MLARDHASVHGFRVCSEALQLPASSNSYVEQCRTDQLRGARSEKLAQFYVQNSEHHFPESEDQQTTEQPKIIKICHCQVKNASFSSPSSLYSSFPISRSNRPTLPPRRGQHPQLRPAHRRRLELLLRPRQPCDTSPYRSSSWPTRDVAPPPCATPPYCASPPAAATLGTPPARATISSSSALPGSDILPRGIHPRSTSSSPSKVNEGQIAKKNAAAFLDPTVQRSPPQASNTRPS